MNDLLSVVNLNSNVPELTSSQPTQNYIPIIPDNLVFEFNTPTQARRGLRPRIFPKKLTIMNEVNLPKVLIAKVIEDNTLLPKNYKEAFKIPYWQEAMNEKYKALIDN